MPINKTSHLWDGTSNSEQALNNKSDVPFISAKAVKQVSDYRKGQLEGEVRQGLFREGSGSNNVDGGVSAVGLVRASSGTKKFAQVSSGGGFRGSGDSVKQIPEIYSPLWLNSNLSLPRDRATINAWCRSFYALNPFVNNAINLHSTYPISKLNIKCANKEVENFFNQQIEELDLMNICVQIAQEYWLLGEAFPYANFDENTGKWNQIVLQNPDYMVVKRTVISSEPEIFIRPDDNLKRIVTSNKPSDVMQRAQLNNHIIESVKRGGNIPLDNFSVSHLAQRFSPYEIRGTGLPVCIFRDLMLFDKLRESHFAQADGFINPMTLIKIGSPDFKPTFADLENWREIFEQAYADKDFKVFTHDGVAIDIVNRGGGVLNTDNLISQLIKNIYIGLRVPPVLMDGTDITYANGGVALDALRQRYMQFRNMMSHWLKNKIFKPIAEVQGFFEMKDGKKKLTIPDVDWNHMSLFDTMDYINIMVQLTQGEGEQKRASLHSLYKSMGLEYEDEIRRMRKENIQSAITTKEKASLQAMDLNALRALDDEDDIPEVKPSPGESLPGEAPGGAGTPPEGLPGLDMGALPPEAPKNPS